MIQKYKLIKLYPGSPELNSYISSTESIYYSIKPNLYPEFWDELKNEKVVLKTVDGIELFEGDDVWLVNKFGLTIQTHKVTSTHVDFPECYILFSSQLKAQEYLYQNIELTVEDGKVEGEDITIYSVLCKDNWPISETTSLKLYINKIKKKEGSPEWKHFIDKNKMMEYITKYKPMFSLIDVLSHKSSESSTEEAIIFDAENKIFKQYGIS